jgi:hypothetical protein
MYFIGNWSPLHSKLDDPRLKMENQVWKDTAIIRLTQRYVCLRRECNIGAIVDPTIPTYYDGSMIRHRVTEFPTIVITDPMGNEFARIVGLTTVNQVRQVLSVQLPPLFPVYQILQELEKKPDDVGLQIAVADMYCKIGIPHLSNRCYDKVLDADTLKTDAALREQVDFNRAVNYSRMNNLHEGIVLFEKHLDRYPASKNRSQYLLWLVKLYLQTLKEPMARTYLNMLEKEYPGSEQTKSARALFVK